MKKAFLFILAIFIVWPSSVRGEAEKGGSTQQVQTEMVQEFQRNNYKKVIDLYRDFADKNPGQYLPFAARVLYAQSLADTGQIEEAINALKQILAELPAQVDPLRLQYDLANLLFVERQYGEARELYQRILHQDSKRREILAKVRERIALMRAQDAKKKDLTSLQLLDVETSLESAEVPEGAEAALKEIAEKNPSTPQAQQAAQLLQKIREIKTERAKALLDEARRLFDRERKFAAVREILDQLRREYADVADMTSVDTLQKEVDIRDGKGPR